MGVGFGLFEAGFRAYRVYRAFKLHMSYSLNSSKRGYIGHYIGDIGDYYRVY